MAYTLGVLTGGGDAPGLNAYLHAVSTRARRVGWSVLGLRNGFDGLLRPERYPEGGVVDLSALLDRRDTTTAGTVLGAASGGFPALDLNLTQDLVSMLRAAGIDALVAIGGDGTQLIARMIARAGYPVVGLPKTIDNDLDGTSAAVGFDSALTFLTESATALRHHADAHRRVMLLETMGRNSGFLALATALASGADAVLIPEVPYDIDALKRFLGGRLTAGASSLLVVVAEGAHEIGTDAPGPHGLGGVAAILAEELRGLDAEVRSVQPAHIQRAAPPTVYDRLLALRLGSAAVDALNSGCHGVLIGWTGTGVSRVPLAAIHKPRRLHDEHLDLQTARSLGIFLGN